MLIPAPSIGKERSSTFKAPPRPSFHTCCPREPLRAGKKLTQSSLEQIILSLNQYNIYEYITFFRAVRTLLRDVVAGAVLQPVMDLLADPDVINLILEVAFDDEPSSIFPPASGDKTELLKRFASPTLQHQSAAGTALHMDLSAILKDQDALFAFMQFLKEENRINHLQFCLSIGISVRLLYSDLTLLHRCITCRGLQQAHHEGVKRG
jgi:hypothetical protein